MTVANTDKTSDKENDPHPHTSKPSTATPPPAAAQDVGGCVEGSGATSNHQFQSYVNGNGYGVYKIIKTLGKGNFAKVKLAIHLPTGREVAIKLIDKTSLNTIARQKLYREVKIMKMLNHPNIVRLFQVIESERTLYLVMEYVSGGELFDHLVKNGRMREYDARVLFRQLVSAIEYCHRKSIVHRDLKAENLLLDQHMKMKIADFGFSTTFEPKAQLKTFCGSPPYAAPELFRGKKYSGPEVDSWSLGVVLYTLVTGSLPFDGINLRELRDRVLRAKYRVPYYISIECESLIRKFLVLNPTKRITLSAVMADQWINMGYEEANGLTPFQEKPMDLQDIYRLDLLSNMGHNLRDVEQSLKSQQFDDIYCTYMLLDVPGKSAAFRDPPTLAPASSRIRVPETSPNVTISQLTFAPDKNTPNKPVAASNRPMAPRLANAFTPPPSKFICRTANKAANPRRSEPSSFPQPALLKKVVDVKPTLLSAQRKLVVNQKLASTAHHIRNPGPQTPSLAPPSTRRAPPNFEKVDSTSTPLKVIKLPSNFQTPPSTNDTKRSSRVGFFSKLSARFVRKSVHNDEKDIDEQRRNLTK
ncbi:MAP/microtubule affinity-regulating kinase 3 [Drosophila erecta]|uniref:Serine/threonine-protein kinase par-1 n=1 Tax=Drosophila erecta TaxID=7220 RepID=B3NZG0_DROER|nr:MAP/microtubule affinity-regulating kinase 3 [Drosophila erecta]EDV49533.1 uncharacterized protein Dere_GG17228 [Drosophila erecta]